MSSTLSGLIEQQLQGVFGQEFSDRKKFADAMAAAIQQYLLNNVTVNPGQVVATAGGPTNQVGSTTTPGLLSPQ